MTQIRVAIVEDDCGTRKRWRDLLNSSEKYICSAEFGSTKEALERWNKNLASIAIVDLLLPGGLDGRVHERGVSLSSGERQLLALARAFVARPRVLVLDEATSNLDLRSETQVERALDVVLEGRTALLIAHRLATAMRADRIGVVERGRLVEMGSHDELVARRGRYAAMHDAWMVHAAPE